MKKCKRPSDREVSGHSLRVGAAQDLLIKGYDLAAIMRAGGWKSVDTESRYLEMTKQTVLISRARDTFQLATAHQMTYRA